MSGEERTIIVEPALRFDELEKEEAGDVDECEGASLVDGETGGPGFSDVGDV